MGKWILVVETSCSDPARESEFNEWYDKIHLPDVMETHGFIKTTRYVNPQPSEGKAKFFAAYEIETDNIDKFMKTNSDNLARKRAAGRFSDLLVIVSRGLYKQISSVSG